MEVEKLMLNASFDTKLRQTDEREWTLEAGAARTDHARYPLWKVLGTSTEYSVAYPHPQLQRLML